MKRTSCFTLIELLIVISIIGLLGALVVPKLLKIGDDAESKIADYNANAIGNFVTTYNAVNGSYPSNFHSGFKENPMTNTDPALMDNIPSVIKTALGNGILQKAEMRASSVLNKGIVTLAYGNLDTKDSVCFLDAGVSTPGNTATTKILALKFVPQGESGFIYTNGAKSGRGTSLYINGMQLNDYLSKTAWVAANKEQTLAHDEQASVFGVFLTPTTNMSTVFDSKGNYIGKSKASAEPKLKSGTELFAYPFVLFRLSKGSCEYLTTLTFSDDGSAFVQ